MTPSKNDFNYLDKIFRETILHTNTAIDLPLAEIMQEEVLRCVKTIKESKKTLLRAAEDAKTRQIMACIAAGTPAPPF